MASIFPKIGRAMWVMAVLTAASGGLGCCLRPVPRRRNRRRRQSPRQPRGKHRRKRRERSLRRTQLDVNIKLAPVTNVTVDSNEAMFTTMCALLAAGFESNVSAENWSPMRSQLRERMQQQQGPAVDALREFYNKHALADSGSMLSQYIWFALVAGPSPNFALTLRRDELPPEVIFAGRFQRGSVRLLQGTEDRVSVAVDAVGIQPRDRRVARGGVADHFRGDKLSA
jgi:hypothetical protein